MSTRVDVSPAPSQAGAIIRDRFTRAEVFVEREDLADVIAKLKRELELPARHRRRA